jgi:hypothetical protein
MAHIACKNPRRKDIKLKHSYSKKYLSQHKYKANVIVVIIHIFSDKKQFSTSVVDAGLLWNFLIGKYYWGWNKRRSWNVTLVIYISESFDSWSLFRKALSFRFIYTN